jgi:soluble lytic murein transglycosylase-like protein
MAKQIIFLLLSILLTLIIIPRAKSQIYTRTDKDGVVHFTNVPTDSNFRMYRPYDWQFIADYSSHGRYDSIIRWASRKYGLESALIKAIIRVESNFNPHAVSPKGARGLMQLMPDTITHMDVKNPFDPRENIEAGVRLFRNLMSQLNEDVVLALAAYNAGLTTVLKYNQVPPYSETNGFVEKVLHFFSYYR